MILLSPAFQHNGHIPLMYTCQGANSSPQLNRSQIPDKTQSFALIMDDPDAIHDIRVHWVIYNIPATATRLAAGIPATPQQSDGTLQGKNSRSELGYGGPCPPNGTHRYIFTLYALNTKLDLSAGADKTTLLSAIEGRILEKTELIGLYGK